MKPIVEQIYQHRYGGLYIVEGFATHTSTKESLVIYKHLYPFEVQLWARPVVEWTEDRFKPISYSEYSQLIVRNREEFQKEIQELKSKSL